MVSVTYTIIFRVDGNVKRSMWCLSTTKNEPIEDRTQHLLESQNTNVIRLTYDWFKEKKFTAYIYSSYNSI